MSEFDPVNRPAHYNQGDIECIDVLEQLGLAEAFCRGNAIKYLWRCEDKNGLEDLKKAQWYLNKLIELKEKNQVSDNQLFEVVPHFNVLIRGPQNAS